MQVDDLIGKLGYTQSPNFLRPGQPEFERAVDYGHVFRRAARGKCRLQGTYTLRQPTDDHRDVVTPIVYVCQADNEIQAGEIHRLVWNQDIAPFLIVATPQTIRLYSGFLYEHEDLATSSDPECRGVLHTAQDFNSAVQFLEDFRAEAIDNGSIWGRWAGRVSPETRVDRRLLASLRKLDTWLQSNGIDDSAVSHALIGKYVYLHYLRERDILSDRRLARWEIAPDSIFGRKATVSGFWAIVDQLEAWLNGAIFPIAKKSKADVKKQHVQKVAGVFFGDDPDGQLHLDFKRYDFSYIPIETLSEIYEQFLHAPAKDGGSSKGKQQGAYYTPLTVVNFMLQELDAIRPLRQGMKVADPACGSGAFLVQCYRRLIEQDAEFRPDAGMRPARLREILEQHIFGVDRDGDACRVAELSLQLTLLDYVPDLDSTPSFQLPKLHDRNIFQADFFAANTAWRQTQGRQKFAWIVGNPPWIELKTGQVKPENRDVWEWLNCHTADCPTGGKQVAEAFAWHVAEYLDEDGLVGLLLPAMTLFKDESTAFRQEFFERMHVRSVANFANLAYVLFAGRAERPAAAIVYSFGGPEGGSADANRNVLVYSPLVAEQPANRPAKAGKQQDTWNLVINASDTREIPWRDTVSGEALPWKLAMWGSHRDRRLLDSLKDSFVTLDIFKGKAGLRVHEGFQLRERPVDEKGERVEFVEELDGKNTLNMTMLRRCERLYDFPQGSLEPIPRERAYVRQGRWQLPLAVSCPPHVIVDRARRFAVYSDEFVAVPPRQIGLSADKARILLLKAIALYLSSDFMKYHQFLVSPEWGVSTSSSTLDALRQLPIPFSPDGKREFERWADLHAALVNAWRAEQSRDDDLPLFDRSPRTSSSLAELEGEMNDRVYQLLGLRDRERWLVEDLVHVRMPLVKGKVTEDAIRHPTLSELETYAAVFQAELDAFVANDAELHHEVTVVHDSLSAMIEVRLTRQADAEKRRPRLVAADEATSREFTAIRRKLLKQHSQWVYFDRNLRIYSGQRTYLFKPMQRLQWTRSQALLDASAILAETLA